MTLRAKGKNFRNCLAKEREIGKGYMPEYLKKNTHDS
jgi:hypothetical protein